MLLHVINPEELPLDFQALQRELAPLLEGLEVKPLRRRGPPGREILAAARGEGADLVVLSPHGRWHSASDLGLPRFLLHSVLCQVLLGADCPVWIEPEGGAPDEPGRLLCGVASLFLDRAMIGQAAGMAALLGTRLTLFRPSVSAAISIPGQQERVETWQREVAAVVRADLEALRADLALDAEIRVRPGGLVPALLGETQAGDLIAVRRTAREWGKDEALLPLVQGLGVPLLVIPGDVPRPAAAPPLRPFSPRASRIAAPLVLGLVLALGLWLIHSIFTRMHQPDCSADAYRCAVRENLMNSTKDRLNQPRPRDDPKLGPFKDDPPPKAAADPPR